MGRDCGLGVPGGRSGGPRRQRATADASGPRGLHAPPPPRSRPGRASRDTRPPPGPARRRSAAPRATGSGRALGGGTRRSGSHSVRQWRRREDEQQVRRVSGAWPSPGAPSPNRSPRLSPPQSAATPAARRRLPSPARAAGWTWPGRPAGRKGLAEAGAGGPEDPRAARTEGEARGTGAGWLCPPEGDFRTPRPGGCGSPAM